MLTYIAVYNLTLAPERESPWYRGAHPTISCDRFHFCPTGGFCTSEGRGLHTNGALAAYLMLCGSMPGRLLIPIMKIKDPCARFIFRDLSCTMPFKNVLSMTSLLALLKAFIDAYLGRILTPKGSITLSIMRLAANSVGCFL